MILHPFDLFGSAAILCAIFILGTILGVFWHRSRSFPFNNQLRLLVKQARYNKAPNLSSSATNSRWAKLKVRSYTKNNSTELDSTHQHFYHSIDLSKTALVLVDVWDNHWCEGLARRTRQLTEKRIVPLLKLARDNGITIAHAHHAHRGRTIDKRILPLDNEINLDANQAAHRPERFHQYLVDNGITTLLYAGYYTNECLFFRKVGIYRMTKLSVIPASQLQRNRTDNQTTRKHYYDILLVRDCTIAYETPETYEGEWANKVFVNTVERLCGMTTTSDDISNIFT